MLTLAKLTEYIIIEALWYLFEAHITISTSQAPSEKIKKVLNKHTNQFSVPLELFFMDIYT